MNNIFQHLPRAGYPPQHSWTLTTSLSTTHFNIYHELGIRHNIGEHLPRAYPALETRHRERKSKEVLHDAQLHRQATRQIRGQVAGQCDVERAGNDDGDGMRLHRQEPNRSMWVTSCGDKDSGKFTTQWSKPMKGSKERYLLGQNKTSKCSG